MLDFLSVSQQVSVQKAWLHSEVQVRQSLWQRAAEPVDTEGTASGGDHCGLVRNTAVGEWAGAYGKGHTGLGWVSDWCLFTIFLCDGSVFTMVGQCLRADGSVRWWVNVYNCGSVFAMRSQCLWLWVSVCNSGSVCTIVGQCLHWLVVFVMVGQCLQWCVNVCDGESVCYGRSMSATSAAHHH